MMNSACLSNGQILKSHLAHLPFSLHICVIFSLDNVFKVPSHLAVIEGVSVVAIASVLLVAVEAVIVGFVQEVGGGGGQTLDSVRVLLVLVVLKISQEI